MSGPNIHRDLIQGSDEWLAARCGLITASEVKLLLTSKWQAADNATSRGHLADLVAQRITRFVEPRYISDDMLRGMNDEGEARAIYARYFAPVEEAGFITQAFAHGGERFMLGYSPDGLVGDEGLIEIKSRRAKFQIETVLSQDAPAEYLAQMQAGMLIADREWCDFVSYSGGLPLFVHRVWRDPALTAALLDVCAAAEQRMREMQQEFADLTRGMPATERRVEEEMHL